MAALLKALLAIGLFILALIGLMMIPSTQPDAPKPWEIKQHSDGSIEVLGVHLGHSSYRQVQQRWQEAGESAVFASNNLPYSAEVFFARLNMSGLSARAVLTLDVPQDKLASLTARALTGQLQPSGARRYIPSTADRQRLLDAKVYAITYVPSIRVDPTMLLARFGEPEQIKTDALDDTIMLWLYPQWGLSVRLDEKDKPVFTYQNPGF